MRLARVLVPAGIALAVAGTAISAVPATHRMSVALPGGAVAEIEYRGDVAPSVRFVPNTGWSPMDFMPSSAVRWPDFAGFERMTATLNDQIGAMVRQANLLAATPGGSHASLAAFGNMPAGTTSYSSITTITDKGRCTLTTQVTSAGTNQPPKIVSGRSGDCDTGLGTPAPGKTIDRS